MKKNILVLFILIIAVSCEYSKEIPIDQFIGKWEIQGRSMFDGIEIEISNVDGKLTGKVTKLNNNKYVLEFLELDNTWITSIVRISNYEFSITEKKLAHELFSLYGLDTSAEYNAHFLDKDTIILTNSGSHSNRNQIQYKRIQ